ncbi:MAG: hypothetical protein Q9187_007523 [Circinaria calcarea]
MDYWAWLHELKRYQKNNLHPPKPLTKDERLQVARFRTLRDRIHEGPLYTILGDNVRVNKTGDRAKTAAAHFDPFEGMSTYSQRYIRQTRRMPKLDTRPYVLKFFPRELWSTLEPSSSNGVGDGVKPKKLQISSSRLSKKLSTYDRELSGEPQDFTGEIANGDDDEDAPKQVDEDGLPVEDEDVDDEYADEEEDGVGDYNAEQYFDDGGDDAGDDYDAGDNDAGEY